MASINKLDYFGTEVELDPMEHASSESTYGLGNASLYGHVKLSDALDNTSDVDGGIAATPKAVNTLNSDLSTHKTTGATNDVLAHVKLSDSTSDSTNGVGNSFAATPKAVNTVNSSLGTHAGTYANASAYGHVKIADALNNSSDAANHWTVSPKGLYNHSVTYATGSQYGHVKLSDSADDATNNASSCVAATPKAVNTAKNDAKTYGANLANATGTLGVNHGGTGAASLSSGYVLTGNGTGAIKAEYSITTNSASDAKTLPTLAKASKMLADHAALQAGTSSGHIKCYVSGNILYLQGAAT